MSKSLQSHYLLFTVIVAALIANIVPFTDRGSLNRSMRTMPPSPLSMRSTTRTPSAITIPIVASYPYSINCRLLHKLVQILLRRERGVRIQPGVIIESQREENKRWTIINVLHTLQVKANQINIYQW